MSTVAEIGSSSLFLPCPLDLNLPLSNIRHAQSFGFESKIQEKKKYPFTYHRVAPNTMEWPQIPLGGNSRKGKEEGRGSH